MIICTCQKLEGFDKQYPAKRRGSRNGDLSPATVSFLLVPVLMNTGRKELGLVIITIHSIQHCARGKLPLVTIVKHF